VRCAHPDNALSGLPFRGCAVQSTVWRGGRMNIRGFARTLGLRLKEGQLVDACANGGLLCAARTRTTSCPGYLFDSAPDAVPSRKEDA
jgi:hypothetical protein